MLSHNEIVGDFSIQIETIVQCKLNKFLPDITPTVDKLEVVTLASLETDVIKSNISLVVLSSDSLERNSHDRSRSDPDYSWLPVVGCVTVSCEDQGALVG